MAGPTRALCRARRARRKWPWWWRTSSSRVGPTSTLNRAPTSESWGTTPRWPVTRRRLPLLLRHLPRCRQRCDEPERFSLAGGRRAYHVEHLSRERRTDLFDRPALEIRDPANQRTPGPA